MAAAFIRSSVALMTGIILAVIAGSCSSTTVGWQDDGTSGQSSTEHSTSANRNGDYWYFDRGVGIGAGLLGNAVRANVKLALAAGPTADSGQTCSSGSATTAQSSCSGQTVKASPRVKALLRDNTLCLESSAAYSRLAVKTEAGIERFITSESSGQYKLRGRQVQGFAILLKADGSKWYFDMAGAPQNATAEKWFTDMD